MFSNIVLTSLLVELENGDKIYLKSFHSNNVKEFIDFIKEYDLLDFGDQGSHNETAILHATGGGAYKYQDLFE
jgi:pantothenate kinase